MRLMELVLRCGVLAMAALCIVAGSYIVTVGIGGAR